MKRYDIIPLGLLVAAGTPAPTPAEQPAGAAAEIVVPEYEEVVSTRWVAPGVEALDPQGLTETPGANIGEGLVALPGVSGIRRATTAVDPVLRGMAGERVITRVGGVPVHGGCPARMDPPTTYLIADDIQGAQLTLGLPSVSLGPVGMGGSIDVSLDFERHADAEPEWSASAQGHYDSRYDGYLTGASLRGGNRWLDFRTAATWLQQYDYAVGGVQVPANHKQIGAMVSAGVRPRQNHRIWSAVLFKMGQDLDFPALPMDTRMTALWLINGGYRIEPQDSVVERLDVSGGLSLVDHLMDNRDKSNRAALHARTPSSSNVYHTAAKVRLRLGKGLKLITGADFSGLERDATRTRAVVASGMVFNDHLWPSAVQWGAGVFAELLWRPASALRLRFGLRGDLVGSQARAADDMGLDDTRIGEHYARFYGEPAHQVDRLEPLAAAQALIEWRLAPGLAVHVGTGLSMRAAGITERYFAFGPAPGGFRVGNPALAAEKKWHAELGTRWRSRWLRVKLTGFYARVADFILESSIDERDVNGDGLSDRITGFSNTTAHLTGFELAGRVMLHPYFSIPITAAYVWAHNGTNDRPLPLIPPLEASTGLRFVYALASWTVWAQAGVRVAAPQERFDELLPEDATDGYAVAHLRVGVRVSETVQAKLGLENLFGTTYHEHLTRDALLAAGGLSRGHAVPAPGRGFTFMLNVTL